MGRQALGKGLSALIPDLPPLSEREGAVVDLLVSEIQPNPYQPRMHFDEVGIAELKRSILEQGVIQPIVVRRLDTGYQIITGERRWRAVREAGLDTIPALVREVSSAEELIELSLVENIQREDGWTVRKAEQVAKARRNGRPVRVRVQSKRDPLIQALEEELQRFFGTAVRIIKGNRKGKIEIEFYSDRDLERVLGILRREV